jgi:hypothetical protein
MVSTLHTAAAVDDTSRRSGKTKKNINALLIATHTSMVLIQQISNKTPLDAVNECACRKISSVKLDLYVRSAVFPFIQKAATHDITS